MYSLLFHSLFFLCVQSVTDEPLLIIISYDAFRSNYFEKNVTPFLSKLKTFGTTTEYVKNVFPTKTYANHHSIATGLYAEEHGIVGNSLYDPDLRKVISYGYEIYQYDKNIKPIWIVNQLAGEKRVSASMMWPGSGFEYNKVKPHYVQGWNHSMTFNERVDKVISWIKNETKPANLVMMYFEEPDHHAHIYGSDSSIVIDKLREVDNVSKYLYDKLSENNLLDKANVIHLSDHGMITVKATNSIYLKQYLEPNTYIMAGRSPCRHIFPNTEEDTQKIYAILKNKSEEMKNFQVFLKKDLLDRWHLKNNRRTPPIYLLANPGYGFGGFDYYKNKYNLTITSDSEFGAHGYDNEIRDMNPFFIAYGPKIKVNHTVPPFNTVDYYNLFCNILEIEPEMNNGTFANVRDILRNVKSNSTSSLLIAGLSYFRGTVWETLF